MILTENRHSTPEFFPPFEGGTWEFKSGEGWRKTYAGDGIVSHRDSWLQGAEHVILPAGQALPSIAIAIFTSPGTRRSSPVCLSSFRAQPVAISVKSKEKAELFLQVFYCPDFSLSRPLQGNPLASWHQVFFFPQGIPAFPGPVSQVSSPSTSW